ncbi:MAG: endonuclease [Bacteroidota bacterium]
MAQSLPDSLSGSALRTWLKANYYDGAHTTLGYDGVNGARSYMYNIIDNKMDSVTCVYGGHKEYRVFDLTRAAGTSGMTPINCEHTIPQSFFSAAEPMKSDIHHLFPTYQNWNSTRQNFPFADIDDNLTTKWMIQTTDQTTIPSSDIDLYSEFYSSTFEPPEAHKGNLARSIFYFYAMYPTEAGNMSLVGDSCMFYQWHLNDPIDNDEEQRNEDVLLYQGNENPFISNPEWIVRAWDFGTNASPNIALSANTSQITISWGDMPAETGYNIYRSTDSISFTQIGSTLSANTVTYVDASVSPSTIYYYHITAMYAAVESDPGPSLGAQLAAPAPPSAITDLSISPTNTTIDLSWSDVSTEDNYQVYRSTDNISFSPLSGALAANVTSYTDHTANASTTYYYYIVATNAYGSSANSNTVSGQLVDGTSAASNLIISEYIEGSSFNKAIEIANFTGEAVDLSGYELGKQTNGAGSWSKLSLSGTIPDQSIYLIVNNSAALTDLTSNADLMTTSSVMSFNGNDPIALFDAASAPATIIDIVGTEDGGSSNFAKDVTLVRDSVITAPNDAYTLSEWLSFAQNMTDSIGAHHMQLTRLPVDLVYFQGVPSDGFHRLEWLTASEENHAYFEIEESLDGRDFKTIGQHYSEGSQGNGNKYEFLVVDPPLKAYYRLRQVDNDGHYTYSKIIALERLNIPLQLQVFPIPATTHVNLRMDAGEKTPIYLSVYNMAGQRLHFEEHVLETGINYARFPIQGYLSGVYVLEITTANQIFRTKLIKAHQ